MRSAWVFRVGLVGLVAAACSQAVPPAAREADRLLRAGDLDGADRVATAEIARTPDQPHLRRVWIAVALARRDAPQAVTRYQEWRTHRGSHDPAALRALSLSALWAGLRDPSPEVRIAAIDAAEAEDADLLFQDVGRLLDDEDHVVRARAAAALLAGDPHAAEVLAAAAEDEVAGARQVAITALGRRVGARALPGLRAALGDPDAGVRRAACVAIGKNGDGSDTAALTELATRDPDGVVRAEAISALLRLRAPLPAGATADAYLGARIAAVAGADDATLARLAAGEDLAVALTAAARSKRAPAVFERGATAADLTVRALAANLAPGALPAAEARRLIDRLAGDPQPEVRAAAMRALTTLGDEAAARTLAVQLVGVDVPGPRLQAAAWLDERGNFASLATLIASDDPAVRGSAVAATHTTDLLVMALADADPGIRVAAAGRLLERI